jgi:hypothetical protein
VKLPEAFRRFFWDQEFERLSWPEHEKAVTARVLAEGDLKALAWLREHTDVRSWILTHRGRGLSRRQLRYWQIMLDLPADDVDAWVADPARRVWEERAAR